MTDFFANVPSVVTKLPTSVSLFKHHLKGQLINFSSTGHTSTEGSVDSSGFEKLDHDVLAEYGQQLANQMFAKPPLLSQSTDHPEETPDNMSSRDDGLVKTHDESDGLINAQHGELVANVDDNDKPSDQAESSRDRSDAFHERPVEFGKQSLSPVTDDIFGLPKLQISHLDEKSNDLEQIHHGDPLKEKHEESHNKVVDDDSDSDQPDFCSQTPEAEETTFNRQGPLILPDLTERIEELQQDEAILPDVGNPNVPLHTFSQLTEHGDFEDESHPQQLTHSLNISEGKMKPSVPDTSVMAKYGFPSSCNAEPWFDFKSMDPRVLDLVYWRDPKKSSIALLLSLFVIIIFARYPVLSVISYIGLAILIGTLGYRLFKTVEGHIKKTSGDNPFHEYLAQDWSLSQERVHAQVDILVEHGTMLVNQLKRLLFIESITDSIKFGLILWSVTHIASWFSGFALTILFVLGMFTIPKVYETYEEPIDAQFAVIHDHVKNLLDLIEAKLPFLKKAEVETEKKDQ